MKVVPIALLCLLTLVPSATTASETIAVHHDARLLQLERWEAARHFVTPTYAQEQIKAADENSIPWTLLPAIELVESGGCKHAVEGNFDCYGYGSGLHHFASQQSAIDYLARQLGSGRYYAGKSIDAKLRTYNSVNPSYAPTVEHLMVEIANERTN